MMILFYIWVGGTCVYWLGCGLSIAWKTATNNTEDFKPTGILIGPFWPFMLVGAIVGGIIHAWHRWKGRSDESL